MKPLRLITLPISHYCEKVRWVLDRQGVPYVEEGHAPLLHAFFTMPLTGGKSRTVPILVDDNVTPRRVLSDSTDCLRYLADHYGASWLYAPPEAAELEDELDEELLNSIPQSIPRARACQKSSSGTPWNRYGTT